MLQDITKVESMIATIRAGLTDEVKVGEQSTHDLLNKLDETNVVILQGIDTAIQTFTEVLAELRKILIDTHAQAKQHISEEAAARSINLTGVEDK